MRGENGNQVVHGKDDAGGAGPPLRKLAARHVRDFVAGHGDAAGGRHIQAPEKVEQGGLAGAAGTHEGDEVALVDIQVKPLKHLDFLAAAAIGLVQAADADEALRIAASINSDHASLLLRSEEHTSELQSRLHLVCRLLLEKKNTRDH